MLSSFLTVILYGNSILIVASTNPIHSILILILVFLVGSLFLFLLKVEYLALLQLIVYVGAIVVSFLFIVMMLGINKEKVKTQDLKHQAESSFEKNIFSFRLSSILPTCFLEDFLKYLNDKLNVIIQFIKEILDFFLNKDFQENGISPEFSAKMDMLLYSSYFPILIGCIYIIVTERPFVFRMERPRGSPVSDINIPDSPTASSAPTTTTTVPRGGNL